MTETVYRILLCPNAFKGSLTPVQAARAMQEGIAAIALPGVRFETVLLPMADGGDGTLETLVEATGGTYETALVQNPLGETVTARWGRLGGAQRDTAVIEMAEASGLRLLRPKQYNPLRTSTFGTGELMRIAVEAGCRTLLVGIGGSATNDGGAGMAQALGARFLDAERKELPPGGLALAELQRIERASWNLPADVSVRVACDVDNPLCGPEGASTIYGPQKGATLEMIARLDAALARYADVLKTQMGKDVANVPGAGAAGGLGAGLMAFCGAKLEPGAEFTMEAVGFDTHLAGADLILTGEGRLDSQTVRGKAVAAIARRAKQAAVPVVALAGSVESGIGAALEESGIAAAFSITNGPLTLEEAMRNGHRLLTELAEWVVRLFVCRP